MNDKRQFYIKRAITGELESNKLHYDYELQCWIEGGIVQRCNHPIDMGCTCYGAKHAGERIPA